MSDTIKDALMAYYAPGASAVPSEERSVEADPSDTEGFSWDPSTGTLTNITPREGKFKVATAPTGVKFDNEKPDMSLLSSKALVEIAKVMTAGKKKYAAHNWRGGIAYSRLIAAAMRHLTAYNDGESKDPETGLSHIAHLSCCAMFLLEFEITRPELDDRYKHENNK